MYKSLGDKERDGVCGRSNCVKDDSHDFESINNVTNAKHKA